MHMMDALLSPAVGVTMNAVSIGAIAYSVRDERLRLDAERTIPTMAVMGAFVFAAQMVNFAIPMTGSSGHIAGGVLLAALLGGCPAFLTMTAVLLIQALFFADGGIFALGCNVFNMGVVPCLLVYPLFHRIIQKKGMTRKGITMVSLLSGVVAVQLGAFCVVVESSLSDATSLPFVTFLGFMQPIHLVIGCVEGVATAAILNFLYRMRPEIMESAHKAEGGKKTQRTVLATFAIMAILVGGVLAAFTSSKPDGMEWSIEKVEGVLEENK